MKNNPVITPTILQFSALQSVNVQLFDLPTNKAPPTDELFALTVVFLTLTLVNLELIAEPTSKLA